MHIYSEINLNLKDLLPWSSYSHLDHCQAIDPNEIHLHDTDAWICDTRLSNQPTLETVLQ